MPEKTLTVTMTENERDYLLGALTDKSLTTRSYISSYDDVVHGPGPADLCCETHHARFEGRQDQRDALVQRHATVAELTQRIEDASPAITLTGEQLATWAGRELDHKETQRLVAAIEHSSIPEAIATIVASLDD